MAAQDLDQLFMNDLDDLLGRGEGGKHLFTHGLDLDIFDELFDNAEIDIGLEQRQADFPQSALHVFGRELAFAAQVLKNPLQFIR